MKTKLVSKISLVAIFACSFLLSTSASTINWVDWTGYTSATSVDGDLGSIDVDYIGSVAPSFIQTGTGINFWTEGSPAPYTGNAVVGNAPTASELIALNVAGTHSITFSQAVLNPIMAFLSTGQPRLPVTYDFGASPFSLLSEGKGYWGDGSYTTLGNTITGNELHGVIQFSGSFSSISWTTDVNENWHGFTFGVEDRSVPDSGSTILLTSLALLSMVAIRRKLR